MSLTLADDSASAHACTAEPFSTIPRFRSGLATLTTRLQAAYGDRRRSPLRTARHLLLLVDRLQARVSGGSADHPPAETATSTRKPLSFKEHRAIGRQLGQWRNELLAIIDQLSSCFRASHPIARRLSLLLIGVDDLRWILDDHLAAESTLSQWNELRLDQCYMGVDRPQFADEGAQA